MLYGMKGTYDVIQYKKFCSVHSLKQFSNSLIRTSLLDNVQFSRKSSLVRV